MINYRDAGNLDKQVKDAAVCYDVIEMLLRSGDNLWRVPNDLAQQALEAHKKAQDRRDSNKDKRTVRFKDLFSWCCVHS